MTSMSAATHNATSARTGHVTLFYQQSELIATPARLPSSAVTGLESFSISGGLALEASREFSERRKTHHHHHHHHQIITLHFGFSTLKTKQIQPPKRW
jgi:hypothetical protein